MQDDISSRKHDKRPTDVSKILGLRKKEGVSEKFKINLLSFFWAGNWTILASWRWTSARLGL